MIQLKRKFERKNSKSNNTPFTCLICLASMITSPVFSQEIDTVIIEKETIIIQKDIEVETVEYDMVYMGFYTKMYYSPGYAFNLYSYNGEIPIEYTQNFSCAHQYNISHSLGFDIGFWIERFILQAGFRYNYTSLDFHYWEYETLNQTIIQNTGGSITTNTIFVDGNGIEKINSNIYHSIHIPIVLGYSIIQSKSQLSICGGIDYNILLGYKGVTYDYSSTELIGISDENIYENLLGLQINIEYSYNINDHLSLLTEPYSILYFSTFFDDGQFSYKYCPVGLKMGIKWEY